MAGDNPRSFSRRTLLHLAAGTAVGAGLARGRAAADTSDAPRRPEGSSSMIGVPFERTRTAGGSSTSPSGPAGTSEQSVASRSAPVSFPDFTRGRWSEKT
jgi:hypothetical protein